MLDHMAVPKEIGTTAEAHSACPRPDLDGGDLADVRFSALAQARRAA